MMLSEFLWIFFFFKQKTAYDMRISDWSSDVCSSDLALISRDVERLETLIADDLIHIHGNGKVEGKSEYLEGIRARYRFYRVDRKIGRASCRERVCQYV